MNFRNISSWSIRNPVLPLVLFAGLLMAGIVAFMRMDVNNNPDIDFPAVRVEVFQPSAAPSELETQVTQRVEAAVRGINGVDEIISYAREGSSFTVVQFVIGTPVDRAVNDVRNAVSQIRSDLPEGILEPQITRIDIAGEPIAYFSVEAADMTLEQLSWLVDNTVAKRLLGIEGMAAVSRGGGVDREIRVILNPEKLQALGVTASQINQQLRLVNINAAGGRTEIAGAEQSVRVLGNARTAFALGQTQIQLSGGRSVRLNEIADVRDMFAEQRSLALMNGKQVTSISLEKAKGSSDVAVYDAAKKELEAIAREYPQIRFKELYTSVGYTRGQYHSAIIAMIEGAILAVIVVWLFLRDWRATVISALAIPLSAIPAFWFMDMMGFTLNGLSLLALSLVAGVLVDDAIVEIENIVRHMRMGKSAWQAAIDAADEIGLAVVATTMSIVAVFLPVALMPGISGQFFIQFGMTVVVAVLLSLAVARMITPMVAAYFLEAHGKASHGEGWLMDRYMATLRWSLEHRWKVVLLGGGGALAATVLAFATLPFTFQPSLNTEYSQIKVELVPGTTLEQARKVTQRVIDTVSADKDVVENAFSRITPTTADIYMTLRKDRPIDSVSWERRTTPKLTQIADARVNFQSQAGGGAPGSGRDITNRFAEITKVNGPAVLLGELIIPDEQGLGDFSGGIQTRNTDDEMKIRALSQQRPAMFVAFDILEVAGEDITRLPARQRRLMLEAFYDFAGARSVGAMMQRHQLIKQEIVSTKAEVKALLERERARHGEGIMLKDLSAPYVAKRGRNWMKVKTWQDREFKVEHSENTGVGDGFVIYIKNKGREQCVNMGDHRMREHVRTHKDVTVEVKFLSEGEDGALRFPSVRRIV